MIGTVWISDFDRGMIETLGAELVDYTIDDGIRQQFAINFRWYKVREIRGNPEFRDFAVNGPVVFEGKVPVYFIAGSPPFNPKYYPCILVRRETPEAAMQNGGQAWGVEHRRPATGDVATVTYPDGTTRTGPRYVEFKAPAVPHQISYEIDIRARGDSAHQVATQMYRAISRVLEPPGCSVFITDSAGDRRSYDAFIESVSSSLDMLDLTARDIRWTISVMIHGEIDFMDPYSEPTLVNLPTTTIVRR